eukprot:g8770.t1
MEESRFLECVARFLVALVSGVKGMSTSASDQAPPEEAPPSALSGEAKSENKEEHAHAEAEASAPTNEAPTDIAAETAKDKETDPVDEEAPEDDEDPYETEDEEDIDELGGSNAAGSSAAEAAAALLGVEPIYDPDYAEFLKQLKNPAADAQAQGDSDEDEDFVLQSDEDGDDLEEDERREEYKDAQITRQEVEDLYAWQKEQGLDAEPGVSPIAAEDGAAGPTPPPPPPPGGRSSPRRMRARVHRPLVAPGLAAQPGAPGAAAGAVPAASSSTALPAGGAVAAPASALSSSAASSSSSSSSSAALPVVEGAAAGAPHPKISSQIASHLKSLLDIESMYGGAESEELADDEERRAALLMCQAMQRDIIARYFMSLAKGGNAEGAANAAQQQGQAGQGQAGQGQAGQGQQPGQGQPTPADAAAWFNMWFPGYGVPFDPSSSAAASPSSPPPPRRRRYVLSNKGMYTFTPEEDALIHQGVEYCRGLSNSSFNCQGEINWIEVQRRFLPNRNANAIRQRYHNLRRKSKKKKKEEEGAEGEKKEDDKAEEKESKEEASSLSSSSTSSSSSSSASATPASATAATTTTTTTTATDGSPTVPMLAPPPPTLSPSQILRYLPCGREAKGEVKGRKRKRAKGERGPGAEKEDGPEPAPANAAIEAPVAAPLGEEAAASAGTGAVPGKEDDSEGVMTADEQAKLAQGLVEFQYRRDKWKCIQQAYFQGTRWDRIRLSSYYRAQMSKTIKISAGNLEMLDDIWVCPKTCGQFYHVKNKQKIERHIETCNFVPMSGGKDGQPPSSASASSSSFPSSSSTSSTSSTTSSSLSSSSSSTSGNAAYADYYGGQNAAYMMQRPQDWLFLQMLWEQARQRAAAQKKEGGEGEGEGAEVPPTGEAMMQAVQAQAAAAAAAATAAAAAAAAAGGVRPPQKAGDKGKKMHARKRQKVAGAVREKAGASQGKATTPQPRDKPASPAEEIDASQTARQAAQARIARQILDEDDVGLATGTKQGAPARSKTVERKASQSRAAVANGARQTAPKPGAGNAVVRDKNQAAGTKRKAPTPAAAAAQGDEQPPPLVPPATESTQEVSADAAPLAAPSPEAVAAAASAAAAIAASLTPGASMAHLASDPSAVHAAMGAMAMSEAADDDTGESELKRRKTDLLQLQARQIATLRFLTPFGKSGCSGIVGWFISAIIPETYFTSNNYTAVPKKGSRLVAIQQFIIGRGWSATTVTNPTPSLHPPKVPALCLRLQRVPCEKKSFYFTLYAYAKISSLRSGRVH